MIIEATRKVDLGRALLDPASVFRQPGEVVGHPRLSHNQQVEILCRWAYDATELAVAEEEGMGGGGAPRIDAVMAALHRITGGFDVEHTAPTKHAAPCADARRGWPS